MFGVLATLPDASSSLASLGAWSNPLLNELMPFVFLAGGLLLGVALVIFLIRGVGMVANYIRGG
jgi:hypothetical protein